MNFLSQVVIQGLIITLLWLLVSRDAGKVRERHGATPANVSAFAWGALCGTTWVALIPYLILRGRVAAVGAPTRERNLLRWWIVLMSAATLWASSDYTREDANNGIQRPESRAEIAPPNTLILQGATARSCCSMRVITALRFSSVGLCPAPTTVCSDACGIALFHAAGQVGPNGSSAPVRISAGPT
jgi:hypothetical protein